MVPLGFFSIKSPQNKPVLAAMKQGVKARNFSILDEKNSINLNQAAKTVTFQIMFLIQLLMAFQLNVVMVHFIPYATDMGITPLVASRDIALLSIVSVFGRMYGGWLSDKIGRKTIVTFAMLTQAISCFFLLFIKDYIFLYLFIYTFGISYGGWASQSAPLAADIFGNKHFGTIWGIITLAIGLGGAIGPLLAGWIYDFTGNYIAIFSFNVFINLLSFILSIIFIKPLLLKDNN